ncbi:MAG: ATP12 family protein [Pseudomonadota bacterium]
MKRFYESVGTQSVDAMWQVTLDGRGLKTVKGTPQMVPNRPLAQALAREWEQQGEKLDPASFPMRDMADYAIDIVAADLGGVADKLVTYGDTDTLCYRADPDEPLFAHQQKVWEPLVKAFEARESVEMTRVSGIVHHPQPDATMATLRARLSTANPFALAGIEAMSSLAASLVIGLTAARPDTEPTELWRAASLEEEWQADLWGRDPEAEERRAKREADFLRACEFTRLAQG